MASVSLTPPTRPSVFTAGTDLVQVWWGDLPTGEVDLDVAGRRTRIDHPGGPGAQTVELGDTPREGSVTVQIRSGDLPVFESHVAMLDRPPGEELYRFATVSDLHLGTDHFGLRSRMVETDRDGDRHPERCLRSALRQADRRGCKHLFVKGDITHTSTQSHWELAARSLGQAPMPTTGFVGNHDRNLHRVEPWERGVEAIDMNVVVDVDHLDVPGLRVIMANTSVDTFGFGRIRPLADRILSLAADSETPCLLLLHQQLQPLPVPYYWPYGIPSHVGLPFARRLAEINPASAISSGHTHRNRVRRRGGLTYSEVGSIKDYPGVWAEYVVFEGGLTQVNHRIEAEDCVDWLEYTRRCAGGAWGRWSPGKLDDRRFSVTWPSGRSAAS